MLTISEAQHRLLEKAKKRFKKNDLAALEKAIAMAEKAHAGQTRGTGEPYVCHSLAVAELLFDWGLDLDTLIAAVLHDVPEDTSVTLGDVEQQFGAHVAEMVEGVTKLSNIRVPRAHIDYEVEYLRKLFLAMAQDLRVVLLKLADRLHNMRTIKGISPGKRRRIGRETLEIFAPLADRLGMGEVRSELEDLGFRYADPTEYQWTKSQVQRSYDRSAKYLSRVKHEFTRALKHDHIKADINARIKNLHSLYKKLLQKERDIDKIYDLFAIRIIVPTVEECYQGMGVIHQHWQPLPHRIKDYIAVPKLNGYRSLHTTIFGPEGHLLEVQFRTLQMHEEAEWGIAAHSVYAEHKESVTASDEQLAVMRQLASWQEEIRESPEFVDRFKLDMFSNRIFVFTPNGSLRSLASGSTPVDFAYSVHSEIGHTCRGAKVNGVIVPLDTELQNGDVVEILTRKTSTPKRDWLYFVRTGQARSQIRGYFRKLQRTDNIRAGREILRGVRKKYGLSLRTRLTAEQSSTLVQAAKGAKSLDDVYQQLGEGILTLKAVTRALGLEAPIPPKEPSESATKPTARPLRVALSGMSSLLTKPAQCCHPRPGQAIIGYITVGKGISIHRANCSQVKKLPDPSRLISVSWES